MSEESAEATATEAEATESAQPEQAVESLGDAGKQAIARMKAERNAERQRANELAAKVKEFEDASKTQAEKDAEARAELERTSATNAAKALRYEIAEKTGLPLSAAARLQGDTEEALLKDAESLKQLLAGSQDEVKPAPRPDLTQGGGGGSAPALNSNALEEALKAKLGIA